MYWGAGVAAEGGGGPNVGGGPAGGAMGVVAPYGETDGCEKTPAALEGGEVDQN